MAKTTTKGGMRRLRDSARESEEDSIFLLVTSQTYRDFTALASEYLGRSDATPAARASIERDLVLTPKD